MDIEMEFDIDSDGDSLTEYAYVTIFGRNVSTIYTNSEDYVNMWIGEHIHYPNCDPTSGSGRKRESVRRLVVGLDIQLLDVNPYPLIATIQLCVNGESLIYHTYFALRLPIGLEQFMTDPNNTFAGVNLERKLRVLKYWVQYQGRIPYRNLGFLAERRYRRPALLHANMFELAFAVLGKRLVMPPVDPDWDRPVLDAEQVLDASVRAYVSYELGRALLN